MNDTGCNVQEHDATLWLQQDRLLRGKRSVQMFPTGTKELPLPDGMQRIKNERGVFHYNPSMIREDTILALSAKYRENEFLELGPYSKADIAAKVNAGESLTTVTEFSPSGIEIRTTVATPSTLAEQVSFFEKTKDDGNFVFYGSWPQRVLKEMKHGARPY